MSNKLFIRRSEARARLGVSEEVFTKMVQQAVLTPVRLTRNGRAFYASAAVEKLAEFEARAKINFSKAQPQPQPKKTK